MEFAPSIYQQAVFDFIAKGNGCAMVNAVAGSGKTTTIVKALGLIPRGNKVTFLAFNKKIATELQARVPAGVKCATFHSQGYAAWRLQFENCTIDGSKMRNILRKSVAQIEADAFGTMALRLVNVAKSTGLGALTPDTLETWAELAAHFDIELPDREADKARTFDLARRLLKLSIEAATATASVIDFDDMLYMPLLKDAPFYKSDWIFVDEAQDTNAVQLALLRRMLKPGGRLVAVGDPRQAIYGFRGADAAAMKNIATAFNCIELPLSISYRCAQSVVRLAQTIVPHIQAAPTAPEGEVVPETTCDRVKFEPSDVIICRNTAPIVELAYNFIGKGQGCKVLGREIGQALTALVEKMDAQTVDELLKNLDTYAAREMAKFEAKGQEQKAEAIKDKVDCIRAIASNLGEASRTIAQLIANISSMFSDDSSRGILTLCTAHKSKGLEWDRVFVYRPELMPSKWARQAWQQEQESNLQYVAWTRAKKTLVFLSDIKQTTFLIESMRDKVIRICAAKNKTLPAFWVE